MNKKLPELFRKKAYLMMITLSVSIAMHASAQDKAIKDTIAEVPTDTIKPPNKAAYYPWLYGVKSADKVVQSISYLDGKRLEKQPVNDIRNALAGQLAGLAVGQGSGQPRYDNANLGLRGRAPLIIIDGIPRNSLESVPGSTAFDVLAINPEQIESVTVLKDALSTSMLGLRGMNGAVLINTRKSSDRPGTSVSFTAQTGVQSPLKVEKPLSAFDYAQLYNEALTNDGKAAVYTPEALSAYKDGSDPYKFPDVDWRKTILKSNSKSNRYTLNASGNYSTINYFVSVDYLNQGGLFNEDPANTYQTNINYQRYSFRSNVELKLDKNLTAYLNLFGSAQDYNEPGTGTGSIFDALLNTPNNAYPVHNFNGSLAGNQSYSNNIWGQSTGSGYNLNKMQTGYADIGLIRKMDDVLPGSWLKALVSYNPSYELNIARTKQFEVFQYPVTGDTTNFQKFGTKTDQTNLYSVITRAQKSYSELSAGYDKNWGKNSISALLLASYDSYQYKNDLSQVNQGVAGHLSYSYDNRYVFEFGSSYSGNNRFARNNQYDLYPAVGAAWNIHNEKFFKENLKFVNQLKLRASYGKVGNADPGSYEFQQNYISGSGYYFGSGAGTSVGGVLQDTLANPYRVAEKANKLNIGVDLSFSRNRAFVSFDYYNNKQYDLLQQRGYNTAILGQIYPLENIGINRYYGTEINAGWSDKVGSVNYFISGNFSSVSSKIIDIDEVSQPYPWLQRTGGPVNQIRGYLADGFFDTSLKGAAVQGYTPVPGDIKYKDFNGDGIINTNDQVVIGNNKPSLFYGLTFGLQIKDFDLSFILQGVANRDIVLGGEYEWEFQNNGSGQAYQHVLNRWTPATASTATYPRLTVGTNVNNQSQSSFWVQSGDYMRLKNAELGYNLKGHFLSAIKVKGIRFFVNGQNLLTFSKFKQADPEGYFGSYPLLRVVNGGITVKL